MSTFALIGLSCLSVVSSLQATGLRHPRTTGLSLHRPVGRRTNGVRCCDLPIYELEAALLASVGSVRETIQAFERLEQASAPADDLLASAAATALDGRWRLETTVAAQAGSDDLESTGVSNAVNASGIIVDSTSKPIQEVCLARKRIGNEIQFALPLGAKIFLRVAGRCASPFSLLLARSHGTVRERSSSCARPDWSAASLPTRPTAGEHSSSLTRSMCSALTANELCALAFCLLSSGDSSSPCCRGEWPFSPNGWGQ